LGHRADLILYRFLYNFAISDIFYISAIFAISAISAIVETLHATSLQYQQQRLSTTTVINNNGYRNISSMATHFLMHYDEQLQ